MAETPTPLRVMDDSEEHTPHPEALSWPPYKTSTAPQPLLMAMPALGSILPGTPAVPWPLLPEVKMETKGAGRVPARVTWV